MFKPGKQARYKAAFAAVLAAGVVAAQAPHAAAAVPGKCVKAEKDGRHIWRCGHRNISAGTKALGWGSVSVQNTTKVFVGVGVSVTTPPSPPAPPVMPPTPAVTVTSITPNYKEVTVPGEEIPFTVTENMKALSYTTEVRAVEGIASVSWRVSPTATPMPDDVRQRLADDGWAFDGTYWRKTFYPPAGEPFLPADFDTSLVAQMTYLRDNGLLPYLTTSQTGTGRVTDFTAIVKDQDGNVVFTGPTVRAPATSTSGSTSDYRNGYNAAQNYATTWLRTAPTHAPDGTITLTYEDGYEIVIQADQTPETRHYPDTTEKVPDGTVTVKYSDGTAAVVPAPGPPIGSPRA